MKDDLISRQAAIDAVIEWYGCEPSDLEYFKAIIEKKPSAQPEQKPGRWKKEDIYSNWHDWTIYFCSECGSQFRDLSPRHYCPNCGCRMMEVENERQ